VGFIIFWGCLQSLKGKTINGKKINKTLVNYKDSHKYHFKIKNLILNPDYKKKTGFTIETFLKHFPKGTYIIGVRGHAFTIKNGVIYGNISDSRKLKRRIITATLIK